MPAETPDRTRPTMMKAKPKFTAPLPYANANMEPIIAVEATTIGVRIPSLVTRAPPSGEARANTPGLGTIKRAATPTEYPYGPWRTLGMTTNAPIYANWLQAEEPRGKAKVGLVNSRTSNSGEGTRRSHTTKLQYRPKLTPIMAIVGISVITEDPDREMPGMRVIASRTSNVALAKSNAPCQSMETLGPLGMGFTTTRARMVANTPITPNTRKIDLHPRRSSKGPPVTTPIVGAPVIANWNQPTALARCSTPKACMSNAMPLGIKRAPLMPNSTRTAMKVPMFHTQ